MIKDNIIFKQLNKIIYKLFYSNYYEIMQLLKSITV
jgi:hypothetical protein